MSTVTLSETFDVHVPPEAREALHLKPGDTLTLLTHNDHLELIPVRHASTPPTPIPPVRQYRGILSGMTPDIHRDRKDRL